MLKTAILTIGVSLMALPALAQSTSTTTAGSEAVSGATNSLAIEGSVSGSVGVSNNTAPCQQANGIAFLGGGISTSRTLDWCLSEQMAKTIVAVSKMRGEERRVAIYTLCSSSRDYRRVLIGLGYCATRSSVSN